MSVVNRTAGEYAGEHVALALALGIVSIGDRIRAVTTPDPDGGVRPAVRPEHGDGPPALDEVLLGVLALDARIRSLATGAGASSSTPPSRSTTDDAGQQVRWLR